jgi:hypothetical protein
MQHVSYKQLTAERKLNIAEASIVAAGLEYRQVKDSRGCPRSFSVPLMSYALSLDSCASDKLCEEFLTQFVTRLANTTRPEKDEIARGGFLALETFRRIIPMYCADVWRLPDFAERCRKVKDNKEAAALIRSEISNLGCTCVPARVVVLSGNYGMVQRGNHWTGMAFRCACRGCTFAAIDPFIAAGMAGQAVRRCLYKAGVRRQHKYFTVAAQILDEAMTLGA